MDVARRRGVSDARGAEYARHDENRRGGGLVWDGHRLRASIRVGRFFVPCGHFLYVDMVRHGSCSRVPPERIVLIDVIGRLWN